MHVRCRSNQYSAVRRADGTPTIFGYWCGVRHYGRSDGHKEIVRLSGIGYDAVLYGTCEKIPRSTENLQNLLLMYVP